MPLLRGAGFAWYLRYLWTMAKAWTTSGMKARSFQTTSKAKRKASGSCDLPDLVRPSRCQTRRPCASRHCCAKAMASLMAEGLGWQLVRSARSSLTKTQQSEDAAGISRRCRPGFLPAHGITDMVGRGYMQKGRGEGWVVRMGIRVGSGAGHDLDFFVFCCIRNRGVLSFMLPRVILVKLCL